MNGEPFDPNDKALGHYESSKGITRDFCSTCGAKVFFRKESRNPEVWDIGAGLFRGSTVREENWIKWAPEMEYLEDATDKELAGGMFKAQQAFYKIDK
jgi:hypothetical protein